MLSTNQVGTAGFVSDMEEDKDTLLALRHKDGGVSLYIDEEWAVERGVDPANLVEVEIPRELYAKGTVQQLREYVATYLESLDSPKEDSSSPSSKA